MIKELRVWQQFFVPRAPEERLRLTRSAAYEDLKELANVRGSVTPP
jgi:hypothetical protein